MPHHGNELHIPLPFEEAVRGLLKVKADEGYAAPRRESNEAESEIG
jgi:hypothetical protein